MTRGRTHGQRAFCNLPYRAYRTAGDKNEQSISARERALCQLTVCFEFQSRSDRRKKTQKLCPGNGVWKKTEKVTVKV